MCPRADAVLLAAIAVAVGLYLFQPWRIFTSSTVTEDIPAAAPQPSQAAGPSGATAATAPRELVTGELVSHDHASSGTVKILELPDESSILRFEGLDTSDGPDLRVWLGDAPVIDGRAPGALWRGHTVNCAAAVVHCAQSAPARKQPCPNRAAGRPLGWRCASRWPNGWSTPPATH
ncbi:DM13 domain-containing protein [Arthrobacter sp. RHLT1-20]